MFALTLQPRWLAVASMGSARSYVAAAASQHRLYAIGGYNGQTVVSSVEVYYSQQWSALASMNTARYYGLAATTLEDDIFALGGFTGSSYLNTVEVFDGARWSFASSGP